MELWDFIEALSAGSTPQPEPPKPPAMPRPQWATTAQIFIVHQQRCLCGSVVEFADCSGRVMVERTRQSDGTIHIHELPPGCLPTAQLARKIWIDEHTTSWCPACIGESNPDQLSLHLVQPAQLRQFTRAPQWALCDELPPDMPSQAIH